MGRQRLPRHLRQPAAPGRAPRRPPGAQAGVPRRPRRLHARVAPVRRRPEPGRADRCPPAAGRRRRRPGVGDPGDHRHRVPGGRGACPGDGRVRVRLRRRRLARAARRRSAHRGPELALGVLRQPPRRHRDVRGRPRDHARGPRARARAPGRLARLAARHRLAGRRDLRDRRGDDPRLGVAARARRGRAGGRADGGLRRPRGSHRASDHAAADPPLARAGQRQPRPRPARHRDVLDVLPRHALPRARAPLQRAADRRGVPALDPDRGGPLPGRHGAARDALRRAAGPHGRA